MFKDTVSVVRDLLAIAAILVGGVYVLWPESKRLIDETFGIRAWYFQGDFDVKENADGMAFVDLYRDTFYNVVWDAVGHEGTITLGPKSIGASEQTWRPALEQLLRPVVGDIIRRHFVTEPYYGRRDATVAAHVTTAIAANETTCLKVLDTKVAVTASSEYPNQIWLQLVKVDCL